MNKIKIRDKEYNCSNKVYWHIKGLESENNCFNMEIKSHEQSEYKLEQENKQLKEKLNRYENIVEEINKIVKNCSQNEYYYKYNNRYLKSEIIEQLRKEIEKGEDNE